MIKKKDEQDLIEFDEFYKKKIKLKRIYQKLMFLIKNAS